MTVEIQASTLKAFETVFRTTLAPLNQHFAEIAGKFTPELSELDFIKLIEALIGIETLDSIKQLLSHKLFVLYGLQTIDFIKNQWVMYNEYPIISYLFYYFQSKSVGYDDDFFKTEQKQLEKLTLTIIPKLWIDASSPFFQPIGSIFDKTDLPTKPEEHFLGLYFIDLREPEKNEEFSQIIKTIAEKSNTSAIFCVFNGTYVEPVCVFNYQNKPTVLFSDSQYTHDSTKNLIKKYNLQSVHSTGITVHHNGDCAFYSITALNTILSLARAEESMLSVLTQLQKNKLDLTPYFIKLSDFNGIDCHSIKYVPDARALNRILLKTRTVLEALGFPEGFFQLLEENTINPHNFTIKQQKLNLIEKMDDEDIPDNPVKSIAASPLKPSLIHQQDEEISAILQDFSKEIASIKKPHVPKAIEKAKHLLNSLNEAKKTYLIALNNPDIDKVKTALEFKNTCTKLIHNALPALQRELGWGDYLKNMLKKLVNAVIAIFSSNQTFFAYKKSVLCGAAETTENKLNNLKLT